MATTTLTTLQITYDDKVDVNSQSSYQTNQLWTAEDANQVKNVVNQLSTFYDLNLTSDGWKFNFVSTTDRASSISADTNTLQYVSSNSADSSKNINYSGNVLFYASVSAISQMVPNSTGSYDPQPFIASEPQHLATKAYVDGKIKTINLIQTTITSIQAQYSFKDTGGNERFWWFEVNIGTNDYSKEYLWIVSAKTPARKYFIEKINTSTICFLVVNDNTDFTLNQQITLYYYE